MAFIPVTTNAIDVKKEEGKAYVGTYTGSKKIQTKIGEQVIWQFHDEDDKPFSIYGFTNLNLIMMQIKEGSLLRITYTGTKSCKTKFGQKDVHQVIVEIDDSGKEEKNETIPF